MKLVDGYWVTKGEPPANSEAAPIWGCDPRMTGSSITERLTVWLLLPLPEKGRMLRSLKSKDREKAGTNKVVNYTFLACWVTRCCLPSSRRRSALAATCSEVAFLVSMIVNLALACSSAPNIKIISIGTTNTYRIILKDQKADCGEKEIVRKKLQLREPEAPYHWTSSSSSQGPSRTQLMSPQPDSRRTKRKSYFQCLTFDFFSMAVIKPSLLLKQYHPKSSISLGAL
ncbi:hypothetical protein Cgig2_012258 [Carnegiea gigantea]|uniref:Uncharacterized protein n=1 Tax=Carnegiea gigantea TaxID=171969 RepID=A0A9Q1K5V6_9CARY|nr:hypothetical protein Cgig2_012258 [Carnegiea gigantea]